MPSLHQKWRWSRRTPLTDKQTGRRPFRSHRTVEAHLHQIFPKFSIVTRAALRDALAALPAARSGEDRGQP